MAGFEGIVRPVVVPDIRPTPKQSVRRQESATGDAEKGVCKIHGTSGKIVQLANSFSYTQSSSRPVETKRRFDQARVYQERDDGTVNKKNFVDINVTNKLWKRGGAGPGVQKMSPEEKAQRERDAKMYDQWVEYYKRLEEQKNIEIKKRDQIEENKQAEK